MWQSHDWNGLDSAARFILLDGIVLLVLLAPDGPAEGALVDRERARSYTRR